MNLVITITAQRERGVLKRRRSTPVKAWVLIASRALTSALLAIALVVVIVATGRIAYGVHLPGATLPAFVLGVIVGAAAFCCSSFAAASFIRNEDSAQPIIQAIIPPLYRPLVQWPFPGAPTKSWLRPTDPASSCAARSCVCTSRALPVTPGDCGRGDDSSP